jgi:hypothetical protein
MKGPRAGDPHEPLPEFLARLEVALSLGLLSAFDGHEPDAADQVLARRLEHMVIHVDRLLPVAEREQATLMHHLREFERLALARPELEQLRDREHVAQAMHGNERGSIVHKPDVSADCGAGTGPGARWGYEVTIDRRGDERRTEEHAGATGKEFASYSRRASSGARSRTRATILSMVSSDRMSSVGALTASAVVGVPKFRACSS